MHRRQHRSPTSIADRASTYTACHTCVQNPCSRQLILEYCSARVLCPCYCQTVMTLPVSPPDTPEYVRDHHDDGRGTCSDDSQTTSETAASTLTGFGSGRVQAKGRGAVFLPRSVKVTHRLHSGDPQKTSATAGSKIQVVGRCAPAPPPPGPLNLPSLAIFTVMCYDCGGAAFKVASYDPMCRTRCSHVQVSCPAPRPRSNAVIHPTTAAK